MAGWYDYYKYYHLVRQDCSNVSIINKSIYAIYVTIFSKSENGEDIP